MRKIPQLLNVKTPRIKQFSLYAFLVIEANAFVIEANAFISFIE